MDKQSETLSSYREKTGDIKWGTVQNNNLNNKSNEDDWDYIDILPKGTDTDVETGLEIVTTTSTTTTTITTSTISNTSITTTVKDDEDDSTDVETFGNINEDFSSIILERPFDKKIEESTNTDEEIIIAQRAISLKRIKGHLICVLGTDHLDGLAQEPWPKDVKLYQPYEQEQILLPDNANCLAVQAFLRMCNLEFEIVSRANAEFMSPSGKVPFIKCGAFVIAELEGIVSFVNNKGISLTTHLESEQKADMRAYMSLVHNVLEHAELYLCWCDKETYNQVTKPRNGSVYPWPLNYFQTWSKKSTILKRLKMMGWYSKTIEDVYQEVETCCQALTDRLEGKEYFFGNSPTELDALVFGHLFTIFTTPLPNMQIANIVRNHPNLIHLVQRIEKAYFKRDANE